MKIRYLLSLLTLTNFILAQSGSVSISRLSSDLKFLASDVLKGRGTGSAEELKAAHYITDAFKACGLKPINGAYLKPFTFKRTANPHDTAGGKGPEITGYNVLGYLDNKAPYTVIIGAHYDHLGLGHDHNSLDANPEGKIHNGADDNASGTAGVIELARYFTKNKRSEAFNILFMCFSGEELGLLGSKKWCEQPDLNLVDINYMINMDMIGRLNDSTQKLIVYGVGTAPNWVSLLESVKGPLSLKLDSAGIGPSDQTSFYLKQIPVLHFFTGQHSDYHKPSDDVEKLNIKGEAKVLDCIIRVIEGTETLPKLRYLKTRTPDTGKTSFKVTMGVMPDYSFEGPGMRIDGVTDQKPAFKAGILKGDVVISVNGVPIKDVMGYMGELSKYKKGDAVDVEVERNKSRSIFKVQF
jgi:hypothetical protein